MNSCQNLTRTQCTTVTSADFHVTLAILSVLFAWVSIHIVYDNYKNIMSLQDICTVNNLTSMKLIQTY